MNQANQQAQTGLDHEALVIGATRAMEEGARPVKLTKKAQIIAAYESGMTDIAQIVRRIGVRPSYVGQVLQAAGLIKGYYDLFSSNSDPAQEMNIYARFFHDVLHYKTVEEARESVQKIDRLYNYFRRLNDHAGQHHAEIVALTGKNRARSGRKYAQSQIFREWLVSHG